MFFTSGGGNRKDKELIKKSAAASIRDLVIERESGKISAEEFASLAEPLARQIESAEQTREAGARAAAKRVTRLGTFCPGCGSLGKGSICIQCGGAL
ncbi:MAG: hypothetical protein HY042_09700, partial [Spirochaetia bacterium]|nr:hypothetical protein [Spirochaetia bacterium]